MANPLRGEHSFTCGDTTYTLSFSTNALVEAEDALGQPITEIVNNLQSLKVLRALMWAGLQGEKRPVKAVGDLIDTMGVPAAMDAVAAALNAAFPRSDGGGGQNP